MDEWKPFELKSGFQEESIWNKSFLRKKLNKKSQKFRFHIEEVVVALG